MIDHTAEIGEQKSHLQDLINKKSALWEVFMTESDKFNKSQQETLAQKGNVAKVKAQIKKTEDEIRAVKAFLRSEQQYG